VDKFKEYNDSFRHPAGDEVLQTVGRLLRQRDRTTDFVARYGGEEFALVLPNTDAEGAIVVAEHLRAIIESATWSQRNVTASLGAATLSPETDTHSALISAADRALYTSKEKGRNRVTHVSSIIKTLDMS
jgi:diguanylate cyclase (GGDEF)-like protein